MFLKLVLDNSCNMTGSLLLTASIPLGVKDNYEEVNLSCVLPCSGINEPSVYGAPLEPLHLSHQPVQLGLCCLHKTLPTKT